MVDTAAIAYAWQHRDEDAARLLLRQSSYADIDMAQVAQQIEGRRQAESKWPWLAEQPDVWFPPRLNREQSSSEATARYKAALFAVGGCRLADLTGGMGTDSLCAARAGAEVDYIELNPMLCDGMKHNASVLCLNNIQCHNADSIEWLASQTAHYGLSYIDPARRDARGGRVAAFEDCTPNLLPQLSMLLAHCDKLAVKAAPMIDLATARRQLGECLHEVHIVAVKGECKEVLFVCSQPTITAPVPICCVNIERPDEPESAIGDSFVFTAEEETSTEATFCETIGRYLYEPHAALMKGGPYNILCHRFGIEKLSRNTHLYTSDNLVSHFPGRVFDVMQPLPLNVKAVRNVLPEGKAHVVSRNYPVAASALQQQLKLKEGGELFVVATTVGTRHIGLLCQRVDSGK